MESQRGAGVDVASGGDLLVGHPAARCEGEFQLVAVELRLGRGEAGADGGQLDLADAGELVAHLLGLEAELFGVGKVLPFASSADAEMGAEGLDPQRRAVHVAYDRPLHEAAATVADLHVDQVARHGSCEP